ncbi:MAG: type II toxin-antitoxin system HicB family antitoxin [Pirellulales bacterium]|nr:type II toxin-antitoxin system HicB family antitoxin [Pirellulales bacterium]
MSIADNEIELANINDAHSSDISDWGSFTAYRCHICTIKEDDSTFSAIVLNLPGCGSCGDTEEEAIANVREAVLGVIESHRAANEPIPWCDAENNDIPNGAKRKWILVDA